MEKEIKVRKKRFAAFWVAVLLLGTLSMPVVTFPAKAYEIQGAVSNQPVAVGETVSYGQGSFTVTYCDQSGAPLGAHVYTVDGSAHTVLDAEAVGLQLTDNQSFSGWLLEAIGDEAGLVGSVMLTPVISASEVIQENTPQTYTITYHLPDGATQGNPTSYVEGIGLKLEAAVRPGYIFVGWSGVGSATIDAISPSFTGNLELSAEFIPGTVQSGEHYLEAGLEFTLGNVTKVSGDSSTYTSGSTFYVPADGYYTFS